MMGQSEREMEEKKLMKRDFGDGGSMWNNYVICESKV